MGRGSTLKKYNNFDEENEANSVKILGEEPFVISNCHLRSLIILTLQCSIKKERMVIWLHYLIALLKEIWLKVVILLMEKVFQMIRLKW